MAEGYFVCPLMVDYEKPFHQFFFLKFSDSVYPFLILLVTIVYTQTIFHTRTPTYAQARQKNFHAYLNE